MHDEFEMSMMGELNFFLGLQIKQMEDVSAFVPASKKLPKPLTLKRLNVSSDTLKALRDYVDKKSTSGICTFVGYCLTSWFSKKQTALAISTTEAEYLAYGVPTDGPYQTNLPSLDDIILSIQIDREGQVHHIRHKEEIDVLEYQVLTREIEPTLKPLEEIIRENIFVWGVIGIMFLRVFVTCYKSYLRKFQPVPISWQKRMEWVPKTKAVDLTIWYVIDLIVLKSS
ncbi:hypothetical protein Tco_0478232 [Tanacetum coccineum]